LTLSLFPALSLSHPTFKPPDETIIQAYSNAESNSVATHPDGQFRVGSLWAFHRRSSRSSNRQLPFSLRVNLPARLDRNLIGRNME